MIQARVLCANQERMQTTAEQAAELERRGIVARAGTESGLALYTTDRTMRDVAVVLDGITGVCDLCSAPNPVWRYPARDFEVGPDPYEPLMHSSLGEWDACEACHRLIQRADRDGLAKRAAKRFVRTNDISFAVALAATRRSHDMFWAHREGAPRRIGGQDG
jgi:hypothetical protein